MPIRHFGKLDLDYLHPDFVIRLGNLLAEASLLGHEFFCHYGYRSVEAQRALNILSPQGAAPPGLSAHQYGLAVDLHVRKPDGTADWDNAKYAILADLCKKHELVWGGAWRDDDHVQFPGFVNGTQLLPLKTKWATLQGTDLEKLRELWKTI